MEDHTKDITIEMDDRFFQVTLSMKDESLIEEILNALSRDVHSGSSLRITKIISHPRQLASWRTEVKTLMSVAGARKG
jgi:hypothetical protein